MELSRRQRAILDQMKQRGRVYVEELVDLFGTTPQTIRRDLKALADGHRIARFHGGATLIAAVEYTSFEARRNIAAREKEAIGRTVAERIPNNVTILINVGTTTAAVARALKHHVNLRVVTDNVSIANDLRVFEGVEVMVPGGTVRGSDGAIVGGDAVEFIRHFKADFAVIGAAAIDTDGTLLDYDLREARVARAIIESARHIILAADGTKVGRTAPVKIGHVSQVQCFVTDRCREGDFRRLCESHGIDVVETGATPSSRRK